MTTMTTMPVESFQHVEDFGHILLQAQKDLERVRSRLHALPLDAQGKAGGAKPTKQYTGGNDGEDVFSSLKDILSRTENSLRSKAEVVLRSVEDNKIQTLPSIHRPQSNESYTRSDQHNASFNRSMSHSGSDRTLARKAASQKRHVRRPVKERLQEARTLQMMSNPEATAARQFLLERYALPQRQDPSREPQRPIQKYSNKTSGHVPKGIAMPQAQARVLPKLYRNNPKHFPHITTQDTMEGVYRLQNRGMIPTFADVGAAFAAEPAPMQQAPSQFHSYHEQFDRLQIQAADTGFNLANLKLDLASAVMDETYREEPRLMAPPTPEIDMQPVKPMLMSFPGDMCEEEEEAPPPTDEPLMLTDQTDPHQIRDYDELLDTYSLHQFIIRKGKTLHSTPEFLSFQRKYQFMWGSIKSLVQKLEHFLSKYNVAIAYINGQKVVELAEQEEREPTVRDLLDCLDNVDKEALLAKVPGERYNRPGGQTLAAEKIQATYKMFSQRRVYLDIKFQSVKAMYIQVAWRKYMRLQGTRQTIADRWRERLTNWQGMCKKFKQNWQLISTKKRVVVHCPSLSMQPHQRQNIHNFSIRENAQLTRLCEALDPDVDIIYISPFKLNHDVHQYYLKLLEVGGVENGEERLKVLVPENYNKFPEHFSLAKLAFYSPQLLKRIKQYIRGRPAYIVPCELGPEDLQLAVELNLPMLAPEPDIASTFGSKSGSKRIFAAAEVPMPIGAHDIYDDGDFYSYFAKLIVDQLDCQRWCMKLDHEFGGRGTAFFDPSSLKVIQQIRHEKASHAVRWRMPEIVSAAQSRVEAALRNMLPKKAVLACPAVYENSWDKFEEAFHRVGGVIEACPAFVLSSPSANLLIEPDGTVNITDTHDQLFSSPFVYCGATFPSSAPCDLLHTYATQIGRACYKEGIIGHIGVDFVMWYDNEADAQRLWAVDLNLRMTHTHASFKLFNFLMKGTYDTSPRAHVDQMTGLVDARIKYKVPDSKIEGEYVERFYSTVNYIYQPNLATVQFGSFFNSCRLQGVSFDLRAKSGTAFMMMDSLASGTLGLLCVGQTVSESLKQLVAGLGFLQEQVGLLKLSDHVYADESNLVDVLNVAKAMFKVTKASEESPAIL